MAKPIDITGKRYGRLIAIRSIPRPITARHSRLMWECKCDCGNIKTTTGKLLRNGNCRSCGCLQQETRRHSKKRKLKGESGFNSLLASYRASARSRNVKFELGQEEFRALTWQNCHYCGLEPKQVHTVPGKKMTKEGLCHSSYIYNGIDRVDSSKGYLIDNCVSCCKNCNYAKRKMTIEQFLEWAQRIASFQQNIKHNADRDFTEKDIDEAEMERELNV